MTLHWIVMWTESGTGERDVEVEADNDIINTFANDFTQRSYDSFIVAKWGYTPCHNRE